MTEPTATAPVVPANQTQDQNWQVPMIFFVLALLIFGGFYLFYQKKTSPSLSAVQTDPTSNQGANGVPPEDTQYITASRSNPSIPVEPDTVETFVTKLSECIPYETTFTHPLSGETLEREILGFMDEKCSYSEAMPNGGRMDCKFSEGLRQAAARYYADAAKATSSGTSLHFDSDGQKITYTIDGNEVDNPLQTALDSGECKIVGY